MSMFFTNPTAATTTINTTGRTAALLQLGCCLCCVKRFGNY